MWRTSSSFVIIDKLYFGRDYVFDLKIGIDNPRNGTIEIKEWALGDRFRENANLRWRKPERRGNLYYLSGILPKREIFLKLKIKTNDISGIGIGYIYFIHLYKKYYFKITLATTKNFYFNDKVTDDLVPYITGYNFEYGIFTEKLKKEGGIHPLHPLVRKFSQKCVRDNKEKTVKELMRFVMNIFGRGINVTYIGDYPDYYYLERFERRGAIWGVCSERSIVFVSLLRFLGFPARIVYAEGFPASHAFVEVYINNGWVNVDPSYGIYDDPTFYYTKTVRELSTFQNFSGGVKGEFIKNIEKQIIKYPYQIDLNYRYLKDSITITGISSILLGRHYYLTLRVRWATKIKEAQIKFVFQDGIKNKDILTIITKPLSFKFSEANLPVKFRVNEFSKYRGERHLKIKIYLIKEKILDFVEFPEPLILKSFSF